MNTPRPIISTPEAEASPAANPGTSPSTHSNGSNGARRSHHRLHDYETQESSASGHLTQAVASQAQEQAVRLTREARRQATVNLEQQTKRAARIVGALGTALHEASNQLRAEDEPLAANYYDMAGDRVDLLASSIERQDPENLIAAVQRFAGRQPLVFFGAAAVVGIVGVRALKSSTAPRNESRPSGALHAGAQ